jgi:hypothetical protein
MRRQRSSASAQNIKTHYGNAQTYIHKYVYYYLASKRIIIILYSSYSTGPLLRTFQVLDLINKHNPSNGP